MVLTNLEKDEADRLAITDHLDFLETELTRHAATPLLSQEATDYLKEVAASKSQLIGNQRNMRHHAPKTTDMTAYVAEYNLLLAKATRLHAAFHGIMMSFPVTASPPPPPPTGGTTPSIKLPTLELPKFGGNLQDWISFRDLFTSAIHNSSLSNVDKLTHLKSLVTGEAARQIRNIVLSDGNYDVAWKTLSERYENNRELLFTLLKRLFNQTAITTATSTALRSLVDTTKECVRSLEVLTRPTQHWDDILIYVLISKLDLSSRAFWEQTLPDTSIPTLSKVYEFLEQRARALEACPVETRQQQQTRPQQQPRVRAHHADIKCPLGCPKIHPLYMCAEFRKMTPQQRLSEVKRLNRCLNCLTDGHLSSACPSKHSCKTCQRKHNTMLHLGQDGGNQQRSSPQPDVQSHHIYQSNSINAGMLATALVCVTPAVGVNLGRALIDGGSTNSFITERAARDMKLSLRPAHIPTSGLQSSSCGTVKHVTSFSISPHFNHFSSIPVTALVVKSISSRIPSEKLKKNEWKHLDNLKPHDFADPDYHLPNPVDILVGTEIFWSILDNEKIEGPSGQPLAVKSSLGWLVAGANTSSTPVTVFNTTIDLNGQLERFWNQETVNEETKMTTEEQDCENHFAATHRRDATGRFTVSLPSNQQQLHLDHPVM